MDEEQVYLVRVRALEDGAYEAHATVPIEPSKLEGVEVDPARGALIAEKSAWDAAWHALGAVMPEPEELA